jgi:hypothetical protein
LKLVEKELTLSELKKMAYSTFGNLVKVVVDIEKGLIAIDADLHSDLEALLLDNGSKQKNLWGINLYPDLGVNEFIEFDSIINIRPSVGNNSRGIEDKEIRAKIAEIVAKRIKNGLST